MGRFEHKSIKTTTIKDNTGILHMLKGIVWAYLITAIVFVITALLLTYTSLSMDHISLITTITTIVSVIVAGFSTARTANSRGWMWGTIAGFMYAVIMIIISGLATKAFQFDRQLITLCIIALGGGALGGMIGINLKKG